MKLYSLRLELAALRSISADDERVVGYLLPRISDDTFSFAHTSEAFVRYQAILHRTGEPPRWGNLIEDPGISQDAREELGLRRIDPVRTRREADALVENLEKFRKLRVIHRATREVQSRLAGENSIDLDDLTDVLNEALQGTRGIVDLRDHTTIIGGKQPDIAILREALTETDVEFIPTGINAFDEINQGVPRGVSWVIAGTTSGGKSVMLMQIGMHMARMGARVVIVSLEMNRKIMVRRMLSHLSGVPLTRINKAHTLDDATLRMLKRTWVNYHEQVRNNGGRLRIVAPPEDASMDEIFATYRPSKPDLLGVDYLGLTRGMDSEDQWRKMGAAVRTATRYAAADNNIIALLCQLSAEGMIRYSKTIMEHARLAWTWTYVDDAVRESKILTIRQPKSTNLKGFDFYVRENFATMRFDPLDPRALQLVKEDRRAKRGRGRIGHNGGPPLDEDRPARGSARASISDDRPTGRRYEQASFTL